METRSTLDAGRDVRLRARAFPCIERRSPRARVVTRRRASRAHARAPWFFTADAHRARGAPTVASRAARDGAFAPGRWFFTAAERALDALDRDEDRARSEAAYLEWDPADERAAFADAGGDAMLVRLGYVRVGEEW